MDLIFQTRSWAGGIAHGVERVPADKRVVVSSTRLPTASCSTPCGHSEAPSHRAKQIRIRQVGGLPIRDTADCQSTASLRYGGSAKMRTQKLESPGLAR